MVQAGFAGQSPDELGSVLAVPNRTGTARLTAGEGLQGGSRGAKNVESAWKADGEKV